MSAMYLAKAFAAFLFLCASTTATEILQSAFLYDWGLYGLWPQSRFKSFDLPAPRLNFLEFNDTCAHGFYLFAPRGSYVSHSSPMILDGRGNLVWTTGVSYGRSEGITNLDVQMYHGKLHITFWSGLDGPNHRYGMGSYFLLDETYEIIKVINAVDTRGQDLQGDLHEFFITPQDTALLTVYHPAAANLSSLGGPGDGWVLDSIFQEVDLDTGDLIFEWRASEHIPLEDTMRSYGGADSGSSPSSAFDFFHINSVHKDVYGNYIISARHTHQIICIGPGGQTVWVLGGSKNMFEDLSDGRATDFSWQHHARWHGSSTLSLFDNARSTNFGKQYAGGYSRGLVLHIDVDAMTAEVVREYYDTDNPKVSESQGSAQVLEGSGNVLVDYGFYPAATEFSEAGEVLCDVRLAPWLIWKLGMVTSYRGFKTTQWVGRPRSSPKIFLRPSEPRLFVSWNGATEVDKWVLQGAAWGDVSTGTFQDLDVQVKDGFEHSFQLTEDMPQYLRITALDRDGSELKHSDIIDRYAGNAEGLGLPWGFLVAAGVAMVSVVIFLLARRINQRQSREDEPCRVTGTGTQTWTESWRAWFSWPRSLMTAASRSEYQKLGSRED